MRDMATSSTLKKPTAPPGALDKFFKITERGSTLGTEIRGGLVDSRPRTLGEARPGGPAGPPRCHHPVHDDHRLWRAPKHRADRLMKDRA